MDKMSMKVNIVKVKSGRESVIHRYIMSRKDLMTLSMLMDIFMDKVSMKANIAERFESTSNKHGHAVYFGSRHLLRHIVAIVLMSNLDIWLDKLPR